MIHRRFQNPEANTRRAHLHLQIPAVSWLAHPEPIERVASDSAKWAHVGVTNAVKKSQNQAGDSSGKNLLKVHAARFALASRTRTDHKIVFSGDDWIDKLIHKLGAIASVAIEKNYDVGLPRKRADSGHARAAVTRFWLRYDSRTRFTRAFCGSIAAAVIDNDHFVGQTGRQTFAHHSRDGFFFVQCRDNDADMRGVGFHRKTSQALVK